MDLVEPAAAVTGPHGITSLRGLFAGGRLLVCAIVGVLATVLLPETLRLPERIASGWVIGAALFLGLVGLVIRDSSPRRVRQRARLQDPRGWMILMIIVAAAAVSLFALGVTLQKTPDETLLALVFRLLLAGLTVIASWTITHTMFALHYAHHYYGDGGAAGQDDRGGLAFPGAEAPDYWDFLYFSFVVGMTCQVSDVQVTSRATRRITLLHGVLSFFFNTVILALAVNLLAGSF